MVDTVENANAANKHRENWQLIIEMSCRKTSKQGAIKESCNGGRLEIWYDYFNNLLRKAQVLEEEYTDHDLPTVFDALSGIVFTIDELQHVKNKLKEGKATEPENIPTDFKKCVT